MKSRTLSTHEFQTTFSTANIFKCLLARFSSKFPQKPRACKTPDIISIVTHIRVGWLVQFNASMTEFSSRFHGVTTQPDCINNHYGMEAYKYEDEISICWQNFYYFVVCFHRQKVNHRRDEFTLFWFFSRAFFIIHQPPLLSSSCLALYVILPPSRRSLNSSA